MFSAKKSKSIVGLDLEAGSVAATEVQANGSAEVVRHGVGALAPGVFREGEVSDPEALGAAVKELFATHKLSRNVRLGIANQRVAVRSLRLPAIDDKQELETAIRFQAQAHIPMPLDQAVLDWQVVGYLEGDQGQRQVDVVAVAARRDMLAAVMDALQGAGLRPVGIDHSAFGMIRALSGAQRTPVGVSGDVTAPPADPAGAEMPGSDAGVASAGALLYCNLGDVTNLAVVHDGACLFTRISAFGIEGIAQKLAERREISLDQAREWLVRVGLDAPVEEIEGDGDTIAAAREALGEGAAKLADELRLSLNFYAAQEGAMAVEGVAVCGAGTTIPGLPERLQQELGHSFEVRRPAALAGLDDASAARLTLSYGLALEG